MENKINLSDVTFLIPVRLDSIIRLENLLMVTDFLTANFNTNIHILEASGYNNYLLEKLVPNSIPITFIIDHDPIFYRTRYINLMVKNSHTPFLAIWDADVIISTAQIIESVDLLRKKNLNFVIPYKNKALETSFIIRERYLETKDLNLFLENTGKMKELYPPNPVGGAFFVERTAYINSGIENEYFYGWGREDGDRVNRWNILDYKYERVSGPLFHLTHERGKNSRFHTDEQDQIKMSEIYRIGAMSKEELEDELKLWNE